MNKELIEGDFKRVSHYIRRFRNTHYDVEKLFSGLEAFGNLILIGGALRDIAYYNREPRDFDIMVDTQSINVKHALEDFDCIRNRFGGYKLTIDHYEFDIWSIQNNWAFKEKLLDLKFENIAEGTFYNIDSIVFNLNTGNWVAEYFNDAIKNRILDIVLEDDNASINPAPEINVARALVLRKQCNLNFSPRVENYIKSWANNKKRPMQLIKQALIKHYGTDSYFSNDEIINVLHFG